MDETFGKLARVRRAGDSVVAELLAPHRVISTSLLAGGLREDVRWLVNHKMCEPDEEVDVSSLPGGSVEGYMRWVCGRLGAAPERTAMMLTAASMERAAAERREFEELRVLAVATAGVDVNAARAGDPASWAERRGRWIQVGTINIMLFISQPLAPGALVKAVMMATEAKTAALQDLRVHSRVSGLPATGTGTDQIAAAAPLQGEHFLTECGHHTKLGELIAAAAAAAVKRSNTGETD